MKPLLLIPLLATLVAGSALAQDRIYRCGNEYTNAVPSGPKASECKLLEGGNVTVVQAQRPTPPLIAHAASNAQRIESGEQRAKDADSRLILEAELRKAEARRVEAGARLEANVATAQSEIDHALVDVRQSRALLAQVRGGERPAAERLAQQADREIAAGVIDRTEWAAALAGARLAQASELDALGRVHAADAALEAALRQAVSGPELQITGMVGTKR